MASYKLGDLVGGIWTQHATPAGQDLYKNNQTQAERLAVPAGWEDRPDDNWQQLDTSKSWRQWRNERTGRIARTDPSPPAPRNYLDLDVVKAHLQTVERTPESPEYLYKRVMRAILKALFKESEGFDVAQEERRGQYGGSTIADFAVLKITRFGGSFYASDYCLVESKKADQSWVETEGQLSLHCQETDNDSKKVYGIVHVGMYIQIYTADRGALSAKSVRMHLRNDVDQVTRWLEFMKANPLPFI